MKRRLFLSVGGATVLARPTLAQPEMPVVGYLCPEAAGPFATRLRAFHDGLVAAGFVVGRDVAIEYRWAEGHYDRLPALASDLARRNVTVIAAPGGAPVALAAKSASPRMLVVFEMGGDPVTLGVVDSLSRPGGNLTGVSSLSVEVSPKRLELLREAVPNTGTFAVAVNPTSPTANSQLRSLSVAAETLGLRLEILNASSEREFSALFERVAQLRAGGLVFTSDPYFAFRSSQLAALAADHAIPTITQSRDFANAGGLMSYGGDFTQSHYRTGLYVGRILRGAKPSDLPVQLVTKLELFVNLKAATALGISLPASVVNAADAVIE
jgi:putative tryptophan/tyrosine transport system substrate-binding protein